MVFIDFPVAFFACLGAGEPADVGRGLVFVVVVHASCEQRKAKPQEEKDNCKTPIWDLYLHIKESGLQWYMQPLTISFKVKPCYCLPPYKAATLAAESATA